MEKKNPKWKKENFLVLILLGILVLVAVWPTEKSALTGTSQEKGNGFAGEAFVKAERDEYVVGLEDALEELLYSMEGVGENKVMITMKASTGTSYFGSGTATEIEGVAVSAKGAGNGKVAKNISEVIQALFGLDAHKIKIAKMI